MRRLRQVRGGVPGYHNYTGGESPMKKRWYDFLWIASLLYLVSVSYTHLTLPTNSLV